jgi:hypothetical protein
MTVGRLTWWSLHVEIMSLNVVGRSSVTPWLCALLKSGFCCVQGGMLGDVLADNLMGASLLCLMFVLKPCPGD